MKKTRAYVKKIFSSTLTLIILLGSLSIFATAGDSSLSATFLQGGVSGSASSATVGPVTSSVTMNGLDYSGATIFAQRSGQDAGNMLSTYSLESKYDTLDLTIGHVDGTAQSAATFVIYGDNKALKTLSFSADTAPIAVPLGVEGVTELRISATITPTTAGGATLANYTSSDVTYAVTGTLQMTEAPAVTPTPTPTPSATPTPTPSASPTASPSASPSQSTNQSQTATTTTNTSPTPAATITDITPAASNSDIKPVTAGNYTISVSATSGGTASGGGTFAEGKSVTVKATASGSNTFKGWYENGALVSSSAEYTFNATANRTLVAQFALPQSGITSADLPLLLLSAGLLMFMMRRVIINWKQA